MKAFSGISSLLTFPSVAVASGLTFGIVYSAAKGNSVSNKNKVKVPGAATQLVARGASTSIAKGFENIIYGPIFQWGAYPYQVAGSMLGPRQYYLSTQREHEQVIQSSDIESKAWIDRIAKEYKNSTTTSLRQ